MTSSRVAVVSCPRRTVNTLACELWRTVNLKIRSGQQNARMQSYIDVLCFLDRQVACLPFQICVWKLNIVLFSWMTHLCWISRHIFINYRSRYEYAKYTFQSSIIRTVNIHIVADNVAIVLIETGSIRTLLNMLAARVQIWSLEKTGNTLLVLP